MVGYTPDKQAVLNRLRRIEGQVRGLQRMVDDDAYCIDVLTQVSATTRALQAVALELLDGHLGHCVREAVEELSALVEGTRVRPDETDVRQRQVLQSDKCMRDREHRLGDD